MPEDLDLDCSSRLLVNGEFLIVEIVGVKIPGDPLERKGYQLQIRESKDKYPYIRYIFWDQDFIKNLPFDRKDLRHYIIQFRETIPEYAAPKGLDAPFIKLEGDPAQLFKFPEVSQDEMRLAVAEILLLFFQKFEDGAIPFQAILHSMKIRIPDLQRILREFRSKEIVRSLGQGTATISNTDKWYVLLYSEIDALKTRISADKAITASPTEVSKTGGINTVSNKKVFVVHGHDEGMLNEVARFIEHLGLKPIILKEQASEGKTLPEKLESNQDIGYAIVLLTPDDTGKAKTETKYRPRARQNAILELGYFWGRLGRMHVHALYDASVEIPSDYKNVVYTEIDAKGAWKQGLFRELKQLWPDVEFPS